MTAAAFLLSETEVAVQLKIRPGWHVYWENPGDFGLPTEASPLEALSFPLPQTFVGAGGLETYGYEQQLTLFGSLTEPSTQLSLSWLACKESTCVPGDALVELQTAEATLLTELRSQQSRLPRQRDSATISQAERKILIHWPELASSEQVICLPNAVADLSTKSQFNALVSGVATTEIRLKRAQPGAAWLCIVDRSKELGYWISP